MTGDGVSSEMAGNRAQDVYKSAEAIAELHACLTSQRGNHFRLRLLQAMESPIAEAVVERMRVEAGINEYHRHLNQLMRFGLVRAEGAESRVYVRTSLAERAVNEVRNFERRLGKEAAQTVYAAALGTNSIRLFLKIYTDQREADWSQLRIRYTPVEIGRLSLFLPRVIEGISAVDKLNEAELLVYRDDDYIHMQPKQARSFYQYLRALYDIVRAASEDGTSIELRHSNAH